MKPHFYLKFVYMIILITVFTILHYVISQYGKHYNIGRLSFIDSIYYTTTSAGMIGFGDIYPVSNTSKLIISGLILGFLWILFM